MDAHSVVGAARDANDHPLLRAAARLGYAANGVIHLLIAWLALRLATSSTAVAADQSSALGVASDVLGGPALLWVLAVGLVGLALWQATEAISGLHGDGKSAVFSRGKAVAKAVVYVALAWTAASVARGIRADGSSQTVEATGSILRLPGGPVLVGLAGLVVIGVGGYHVYKGATRRFRRDLVRDPGDVADLAGVAGYVAKGVALVIVGGLFLLAATSGRAAESKGLSGALTWLDTLPGGPWLLGAIAVGIGCYGVYSFFRARYTEV